MSLRRMFALAALALALPAAAQAAPAAPQASKQAGNWERTVARTPEGGWRMGNPNAAIRVIEYGSVTCPHCADFAASASFRIRERVRTGRLSFEFRPFLIFPSDPGIFMLLACGGPGSYFETLDRLFATHAQWSGRLQANEASLQSLSPEQRVAGTVRAAGLQPFFQQRGMSAQAFNTCLADRAGLNSLIAANQRFLRQGIQGTPTFIVNGRQVEAHDWASLEPQLR